MEGSCRRQSFYIMWAPEFNCMRPQQTRQKCLLPALNLTCEGDGAIDANQGQFAAVHKAAGEASHLVRKEGKLKVPAWFCSDAVAVSLCAL